jgi:imidazolonepropionase
MSITLWRNARWPRWPAASPGAGSNAARCSSTATQLAWVGDDAALPAGLQADAEVDLGGACSRPGLVDCHTHLVYGGQRAREFELRLQGASYEQIARAGGGIRSTVAATRAATDDSSLPQPASAH